MQNKYFIDQTVRIKELDRPGRIIGIYLESKNSFKYNIRYFYNGDIKENYFYEDEIYYKDNTGRIK